MPTVRVREDVYRRLLELKQRLHHQSFSDTIDYLLDLATSPRTFMEAAVYWLEDVRSDVKELKNLLKKFVGMADVK